MNTHYAFNFVVQLQTVIVAFILLVIIILFFLLNKFLDKKSFQRLKLMLGQCCDSTFLRERSMQAICLAGATPLYVVRLSLFSVGI